MMNMYVLIFQINIQISTGIDQETIINTAHDKPELGNLLSSNNIINGTKNYVGSIIGDKLKIVINKTSTKWMDQKAYDHKSVNT